MTRTMVFDLDGTLVDSVSDLASALNLVLAQDGLPGLAAAEVTKMVGDGVAVLLARGYAARGRTPDDATYRRFMTAYGAHVADATQLYPGVATGLRALAAAGWRLAVCTNKPEALARRLLLAVGVHDLFSAIGGGDSFASRKPDPAHIVATLVQAGGVLAGAVMVGDHANDVIAATGAGVPCIFAAWGYGPRAMARGAAAIAERFDQIAELAVYL